jgi:hypothetical protein
MAETCSDFEYKKSLILDRWYISVSFVLIQAQRNDV